MYITIPHDFYDKYVLELSEFSADKYSKVRRFLTNGDNGPSSQMEWLQYGLILIFHQLYYRSLYHKFGFTISLQLILP